MNNTELFLNFGAIVKINKYYGVAQNRADIVKLFKNLKKNKFLEEYVEHFEKNFWDKEDNKFSESYFWHIVEINGGNIDDIAIEFQWGKGFTFGSIKQYLKYDNEMKVLSVDDIIKE